MSNLLIDYSPNNSPISKEFFPNSTPVIPIFDRTSNLNSPIPFMNINSNKSTSSLLYKNELDNNHEKNDLFNKNNSLNNEITEKSTRQETNFLDEKSEPKISNIVAMFDSGTKLNLKEIALICKNTEYNPARFNALFMRLENPKSVALIFDSGKIVVTGAKTEVDSRNASRKYAKNLKSLGFKVVFKDFKIINIVASYDIKLNLRLTRLNTFLCHKFNITKIEKGNKVYYEPEVFPGLIYRMGNPKITALIFSSGKINFVGAKERTEIFQAIKKIYPLVIKFENKNIKQNNKNENLNNFDNIIHNNKFLNELE